MTFYLRHGKRIFDASLALGGLLFLAPLLLLVGAWVWLDAGRPVLFAHTRIGRGGRPFQMHKFRTMVGGAERDGPVSLAHDKRLTRSGGTLRRLKLDELPQLWNVLRGDMSLVGPRPDVPGYADALEGEDRRILELRPGLTGPATLAFSHEAQLLAEVWDPERYNREVIFKEKVRLNLRYIDEISFGRDLYYIAATLCPRRASSRGKASARG